MACPISAVFPAHRRTEHALHLLQILEQCDPKPAEIIVHVDGGDSDLVGQLQRSCPRATILQSDRLLGPGGSRNRLVAAARHELVANFDDDSYPASPEYFQRVMETAQKFPDAAALSAASQESEWSMPDFMSIPCFSGCGCVLRKSWFQRTAGFVPLTIAFNMEEADVGLQLHALGGTIILDPNLRVTHDHPPNDPGNPLIRATILANTVLLPFLRYPLHMWPFGIWHLFSQARNFTRRGWSRDILPGLAMSPSYLWRHRGYRKTVSASAIWSWLKLRRRTKSLGPVY